MLLLLLLLLALITTTTATPHDNPCTIPSSNSLPYCNASLPIRTRAAAFVSLLTLDDKIAQLANNASSIPRLNLPPYEWWSEALHGLAPNGPGVSFNGTVLSATSFPQVILTTSSFNRSLWQKVARAIATEARAMHNVGQAGLTFWAPNINIFRDPRWGRGQETSGEDPTVVAAYAVEYVKGFQGDYEEDRMVLSACCKHYTAYDLEKWEGFARYTFNAKVTEQDLEDTYQPPFKSCIQEGRASCLMCAYNQVNGVPMCANKDLLDKARNEWGFQGYIPSDCDAVAIIYENQTYTNSPEDSVAAVLKAGMDINCGSYLLRYTKSAVQKGKVQEEDIDRALVNLFSVQMRLGLFDKDMGNQWFTKLGSSNVCTKDHRHLAVEAARQGIVLLKNENSFLPLKKDKVGHIAIIGPASLDTSILGGDYSGTPCRPISLHDGFKTYVPKITFAAGCVDIPCNSTSGFDEAINATREADVVVIIAGLDLSQETEDHDRVSLLLPGKQIDLVTRIANVTKKPLVLVLMGGGPLDVSFAKQNPGIASILWIGYPGEVGGQVVAEIIFGEHNPGGRLPVTWYPESFTAVPMNDMNMRADPSRGYPGRTYRFYTGEVVYGFGHGLSYSNYSYNILSAPDRITLSHTSFQNLINRKPYHSRQDGLGHAKIEEISSCEALHFSVHVSVFNHGVMDGSHVILLFARSKSNIPGSPQKQLIGFERVHTSVGKATEAEFSVDPCKHMSTANAEGKRVLPLGAYTLMLENVQHDLFIEA